MRLIRTNEGARQLEELIDNDPGRFAHLRSTNQESGEVLIGLHGGPSFRPRRRTPDTPPP